MKQVKAHIAVSLDGHTATLDSAHRRISGRAYSHIGQ